MISTTYHQIDHEPRFETDDDIHLASLAEKKRLWWRNAIVNMVFIASWCVGIMFSTRVSHIVRCRFLFAMLLSVYNKWMFSKGLFGFPAPLFVTAIHMFVQFLLAAVLRHAHPNAFRPVHNPTIGNYTYVFVVSDSGIIRSLISLKRKKAVPTAVATGLDIGLSNLSLKTITLSFYSEFPSLVVRSDKVYAYDILRQQCANRHH